MGGRRGGSLRNLVGTGGPVTSAKRELTKAVKAEDPDRIANASTQLIIKSPTGLEALKLGLKMAPFLSSNQSELTNLSRGDRDEAIRDALAQLKQREDVTTTKEVDNAIIVSAREALSGEGDQ